MRNYHIIDLRKSNLHFPKSAERFLKAVQVSLRLHVVKLNCAVNTMAEKEMGHLASGKAKKRKLPYE